MLNALRMTRGEIERERGVLFKDILTLNWQLMDTQELNLVLTDSLSNHLARRITAAESICGGLFSV